MVDPSKVFDDPIGVVASQVAGAVQARTVGGERVGQEAFGGQAGAAMVATRQAVAADQQFAGDAGRTWVHSLSRMYRAVFSSGPPRNGRASSPRRNRADQIVVSVGP